MYIRLGVMLAVMVLVDTLRMNRTENGCEMSFFLGVFTVFTVKPGTGDQPRFI